MPTTSVAETEALPQDGYKTTVFAALLHEDDEPDGKREARWSSPKPIISDASKQNSELHLNHPKHISQQTKTAGQPPAQDKWLWSLTCETDWKQVLQSPTEF